jgi:hypothetical protein
MTPFQTQTQTTRIRANRIQQPTTNNQRRPTTTCRNWNGERLYEVKHFTFTFTSLLLPPHET